MWHLYLVHGVVWDNAGRSRGITLWRTCPPDQVVHSPTPLHCYTVHMQWRYVPQNNKNSLLQQSDTDLRTIIHKSQPNSLITLTFRSHHETFIRRSWHSFLLDLDVTINCHIKKTVVGMRFMNYCISVDRNIEIRKNWGPASSDKGLVMRPKRQGN